MSLIDSLLPQIDTILGIRDVLGVGLKPVSLRVRTWSGESPGDGTATDTSKPVLPTPQIVQLSHSMQMRDAGRTESGDLVLKHVSKNAFPDRAEVACVSLAENEERFYQVGVDLYEVVSLTEKHLTWEVQIRRISHQVTY